jgi:manganese-dependent inorganic pyrophosphatase
MLKQSISVEKIYSKKFRLVNNSILLEDARDIMSTQKFKGIIVVNNSNQLVGVITRSSFFQKTQKKMILVDHNEPLQTIEGIKDVEITEIVDHHRIATFQTQKPITFINMPVGSTSTIIALQYKNYKVTPTKKIASILISGILSDTVILKSPTTTEIDKNILKWLNQFAKLDYKKFANDFFKAGSLIDPKKIKEIINSDFKNFEINKNKIGIGQIETVGTSEILKYKKTFLKYLNNIYSSQNYDFIGLIISDISIQSSLMMFFTDKKNENKIPWNKIENNLFELKNILSRKKQVLPVLTTVFEK